MPSRIGLGYVVLGLLLLLAAGDSRAQGYYGEVVRCESRDYRQIYCNADTRDGAQLVNQLSDTACVEGRTWGWDRRGVWVSGGCRGEFEIGGGQQSGGYGYQDGSVVRCESRDFNQIYCDVDVRGGVRLVNQMSSAPCVEGRTWGADRRGLWVRDGCRGEFEVGRGGGYGGGGGGLPVDRPSHGQTLVCESRDDRYRHCPARIRRDADLVRQLSDSDCIYNRSWGYDRNGVWVDRGCRGEFVVD